MKVTTAKRNADRANAQRSTGPRTAAGKAVSRFNGVRHGLRAERVVVPQLERLEDWEAHREAVAEVLAPQNYIEELLVDRAALATWRLNRAARCERGVLLQAQAYAENGGSHDEKLRRVLDDRAFSLDRERELAALPFAVAGSDGLRYDELIVRYETAAERSL